MNILMAASESVPFAKTGGLADVVHSLSGELRRMKFDVRIILPLYQGIRERFGLEDTGIELAIPLGSRDYRGGVYRYRDEAFFIRSDEFFDREELYGTAGGAYEDNAFRFLFFSRAVPEAVRALDLRPHIVHLNDWQTAMVALYMRTLYRKDFRKTASLLTIHNLGYQGVFPASAMTLTGLPTEMFNFRELEFYGQLNLLKGGVISADAISTVSEKYAREVLEPEYGFRLDGLLAERSKDVTGILNGIDYSRWDFKGAPSAYHAGNMEGKNRCRNALIRACSFRNRRRPIAGMVSRLDPQKGIEVLAAAAPEFFARGANLVVLGRGDEELQRRLRGLRKKYPGQFFLKLDYDEAFARLVYTGSDLFLIPSRYEPCGLTQMIAMRYGTVPLARATGGLADTIEDYDHLKGTGSGFLFSDYNPSAFLECVKRALCVYSDDEGWRALRARCMRKNFSWKDSARKYASLYRGLQGKVAG
jgi:starch synthase